jgi:hypothetical protein
MRLPIYQVDAFTDRLFGGNPAAVCPLHAWLPDETMQAIAAENNLAETAFFVPGGRRLRAALVHADGRSRPLRACDARRRPRRLSLHRAAARRRELSHDEGRDACRQPERGHARHGFSGAASRARRAAARPARGLGRRAARGIAGPRPSRGLWQRRGGRGARSRSRGARQSRLLGRDRDRAGRIRHRLRLALFRAGARRPRRPGDRLVALHAVASARPSSKRASSRVAAARSPARSTATG